MGGRLPISGSVPADIAEVISDLNRPGPTEADRVQAREEIRDEIIAGKTRGGFDFAACMDCELNTDGYMGIVHDLATIVKNLHGENHSNAGTWLDVLALAEKIVERHLPEVAIEERAQSIADDRTEDACLGY